MRSLDSLDDAQLGFPDTCRRDGEEESPVTGGDAGDVPPDALERVNRQMPTPRIREGRLYSEFVPPLGLAAHPGNETPLPAELVGFGPAAASLSGLCASVLVKPEVDVAGATGNAVRRRK